jgi:hypothetical protein
MNALNISSARRRGRTFASPAAHPRRHPHSPLERWPLTLDRRARATPHARAALAQRVRISDLDGVGARAAGQQGKSEARQWQTHGARGGPCRGARGCGGRRSAGLAQDAQEKPRRREREPGERARAQRASWPWWRRQRRRVAVQAREKKHAAAAARIAAQPPSLLCCARHDAPPRGGAWRSLSVRWPSSPTPRQHDRSHENARSKDHAHVKHGTLILPAAED